MNKKLRQRVRQRFEGKCAFCGFDLDKAMHIWDIEPIQIVVTESGELGLIGEDYCNLYPACKSCASVRTKHCAKMSIEDFRNDIIKTFHFLRLGGITKTSYGRSLRFGLITETNNPVVFYFERIKLTKNNSLPPIVY